MIVKLVKQQKLSKKIEEIEIKTFLDKGGLGRDGMGGTFSVGNLSIPCLSILQGQCDQKTTKTHINFNTTRTS